MDPRNYAVDETLRDGDRLRIRAIRPDDKQHLVDLFRRLSQRSVRFRFLGSKKRISDWELRSFTEIDFVCHVALVVTQCLQGQGQFLGVGRYILSEPAGPAPTAEVAFAVADEHQGRGIGSILLRHLVVIARARGVSEFEALVHPENRQMLRVFAHSGLPVRRSMEPGVLRVSIGIPHPEASAAGPNDGADHTDPTAA